MIMGIEIEHKYLVKDDSYKRLSDNNSTIRQGDTLYRHARR